MRTYKFYLYFKDETIVSFGMSALEVLLKEISHRWHLSDRIPYRIVGEKGNEYMVDKEALFRVLIDKSVK